MQLITKDELEVVKVKDRYLVRFKKTKEPLLFRKEDLIEGEHWEWMVIERHWLYGGDSRHKVLSRKYEDFTVTTMDFGIDYDYFGYNEIICVFDTPEEAFDIIDKYTCEVITRE